ncbi:S9 family peptidase [Cyclobacteriaceae bacterium]|nr:S9 family peptidase [Cyclobacteriaceae bacterium]
MKAPIAPQKPHELSIHGDTRIDNYFWLNNKEDTEVIDYLNQENAFTKGALDDTESLQNDIYKEIVGRIKTDDQSIPYLLNGYSHYTRFEKGKEYPIYCRKEGETLSNESTKDEQILLDVNLLADGKDYFEVGSLSVSPNNQLLAYSYDDISRRLYTVKILNLSTGELLDEHIENTNGEVTWAADNDHFFYSLKDVETLRPHKVLRHRLGESQSLEVFEEVDDTFVCFTYKTKSSKFIVIGSDSTVTSEHRYLESSNPTGDFTIFNPRQRGLEYSIDHKGSEFFVHHNHEAQNFMISKCDEKDTVRSSWETFVAHRADVLIEGVELFSDKVVIEERSKGLTQLRVISSSEDYYIDFQDEAYSAGLGVNMELESDTLRYGYTSLVVPTTSFQYSFVSKETKVLKQQEVVGGYDESEYTSKREWIIARDGVRVPVSIVYKKGIELAKAPLLLYAYGSYGYSIDPYFSSVRLSLLDRGFVYAIAHIRGGEELGRAWYEDGKLLNKLNTFHDFIDCGKYLIENGYGAPDKLCAMGGSAGGMLMGGVINMQPELFKAVVAAVPFVDCVTTMLDDTIPLTTGEYDEWGNPNDKKYYDYMLQYSPYDNVLAQDYPHLLVTSGLHDSQVQYWEPTKWVAKLREVSGSSNMILLHTNMEAGHGGASGRFAMHKETAMEYSFLLRYVK